MRRGLSLGLVAAAALASVGVGAPVITLEPEERRDRPPLKTVRYSKPTKSAPLPRKRRSLLLGGGRYSERIDYEIEPVALAPERQSKRAMRRERGRAKGSK